MTLTNNMTTLPYAGFGKRFYAYLIDQSVIQGAALLLAYPIGVYKWGDQTQSMESLLLFLAEMMPIVTLLQVGIALLYGTLFEASDSGATLGKRYCGLRVSTEEGESISYLNAFLRNVGVSLINMIGCLACLLSARNSHCSCGWWSTQARSE